MGEDQPQTGQRLTIDQAADRLGISPDAVRSRVKRGTLAAEREAGRVYVLVDADRPRPADDRPSTDQFADNALTFELRDRLRYVEGQLEAERQAHAEARRLLAAALERIPAIEAPQEPPEAPETVDKQQGRGQPRSDAPGPQEDERRPWWRRVFGG